MSTTYTTLEVRQFLSEQREAIAAKLNEAALAVLSSADENGAPVVAEVLHLAEQIARWTVYDFPPET